MKISAWVFGLLLAAGAAGCGPSGDQGGGADGGEEAGRPTSSADIAEPEEMEPPKTDSPHGSEKGAPVWLNQVPEVVKEAAAKAVPGIVLSEKTERETGDDGVVLYSMEGLAKGKRFEVEVTEAGKVLFVEEESGKPVPLDRVPAKVRKTAERALDGVDIKEAEVETVYTLIGVQGGKEYEIEVSENGQLKRYQESVD